MNAPPPARGGLRQAQRAGAAPIAWIAGRLRGRPDSEHETCFNRLVFSVIATLAIWTHWKSGTQPGALLGMAVYIALGLGLLGHILWRPQSSFSRRLFALVLDCCFLSWEMHLGGEAVAEFFPLYLWTVFGNGFRFGITFLVIGVPIAALSFAAMVVTTPYWYHQINLSGGLLIGVVILPAYAGTLIRKLSEATRIAEEANEAKSLFLASISHELRTPLTAIVGMNGLLRSSHLATEDREMVETIDVATRSLQSLIDGLLDLSRIEAGRMPSSAEEFDLLTLLTDIRRLVESQTRAKGLRFDIHVTPRTPLRLLASRLHLHEILMNLAGNAVKFTETGGIAIAVDGQPMEGAPNGITLKIEVSDTGIGIAAGDQGRIFDNFTQANATILNRFGGTGLGLAITKRLVGLLGGAIEVESALGSGSIFRFHINAEWPASPLPERWPAGKPEVTILAHSPRVVSQLRAGLAALGLEAESLEPERAAARPPAAGGNRVLLVYEPDWDDIVLPLVYAGIETRPPVVLLHETAAAGLPNMAVRRRCAALLGDPSSEPALHQALLIAQRLGGAPAAPPMVAEAAPASPALPPRRVLLVDDNRVNQRVFSRILETAGHEVVIADNGESALDILEQQSEQLDLVLMDFNMPDMDGLEATKLYRMMATGETRLPIVGLTADATALTDQRWRAADMDGCLIKPVIPKDLLATIDTMSRNAGAPLARNRAVTPLQEHPRFRVATKAPLDEVMIGNLRQLGDSDFIAELMADFLSDAAGLIETLTSTAQAGNTQAFRSHAHALQSSAVNVGAVALGELCAPWIGRRGSELQTQAADFATRAAAELARTREAMLALTASYQVNNA